MRDTSVIKILDEVYTNGPITYAELSIRLDINPMTIGSVLSRSARDGDINRTPDYSSQVYLYDMPDQLIYRLRCAYRHHVYADRWEGPSSAKFDKIAKCIGFYAAHRLCTAIIDGDLHKVFIEESLKEEGKYISSPQYTFLRTHRS